MAAIANIQKANDLKKADAFFNVGFEDKSGNRYKLGGLSMHLSKDAHAAVINFKKKCEAEGTTFELKLFYDVHVVEENVVIDL